MKNLNEKYNVQVFSTNIRGGKAFAAEQKIRELKKRVFKFKNLNKGDKLKRRPNEIIRQVTNNMNRTISEKYGVEPEKIDRENLASEAYRIKFDFHRLEEDKKTQID